MGVVKDNREIAQTRVTSDGASVPSLHSEQNQLRMV
ncbi:hypothetical protein PEC301296_18900 [Pectobacterium carotovorum subsp. carotovorum]|nr:hypothetical protein PEC301296_18900 [Pectobacterium carotovorum subsp. carotovorum]